VPAGFRNGDGKNGTGQHHGDPGTGLSAPGVPAGFRNGGHGNGATAAVTKANATTYWQRANDHADKLDRAQVGALAKQVIDGTLSWQEAQSRLDDWIDAATLPSFGVGNGKAAGEQAPVAVSRQPIAERAIDPLDELFAQALAGSLVLHP
jgi:hypothetical protein